MLAQTVKLIIQVEALQLYLLRRAISISDVDGDSVEVNIRRRGILAAPKITITISLSFSKEDQRGCLSLGPVKGRFKEERRRRREQKEEAEKKGDREKRTSDR